METLPLSPSRRKTKLDCCSDQQNDGLRVIVFCFGVLCICVTIALVISIYLGEPEVCSQLSPTSLKNIDNTSLIYYFHRFFHQEQWQLTANNALKLGLKHCRKVGMQWMQLWQVFSACV